MPELSYGHVRARFKPQPPTGTSPARRSRPGIPQIWADLGGGCTQWSTARAKQLDQYPCFTKLFDRYQIGLIRRGFPELVDFVTREWAVGRGNLTSVDNLSKYDPCPIVVNRRFGMWLHRVTPGMCPAAGCVVPCIWARFMSQTRGSSAEWGTVMLPT